MNSAIEELWYGNLAPFENCGVGDEEIRQLAILMGENKDSLRSSLTGKQKELFLQYVKWADQYTCYISAQAFREGFSLATKLFFESMQKT